MYYNGNLIEQPIEHLCLMGLPGSEIMFSKLGDPTQISNTILQIVQ